MRFIRDTQIVGPSETEYKFSEPLDQLDQTSLQGEVGQPLEVDQIVFGGKLKNGFFIEAGAHDFELDSNTLHFELDRGWTGLLVEPSPAIYPKG